MKIIICGGYGNNNLGDDAQLLNNCRIFQEQGIKDVKIISHREYIGDLCGYPTIGSFRNYFKNDTNEKLIEKFNYLLTVPSISEEVDNLIKEIKECDVLFMSGSGTLNTRNYFGMLLALIPIALASKFNKRILLSGQGFLPMKEETLEKILASYLNKCEVVGTRDFESGYKELIRIGVNPDLIHKGIDDAVTLSEKEMNIDIPNCSVAINVSYYAKPKMYAFFLELADNLKKEGFNPIFNFFYPKDKETIDKIIQRKYPVIGFENPMEAKWFFSRCVFSIGMRYHSAILSFGARCPVINLALDEYQRLKFEAINKTQKIIPCLDGNNVTVKDIMSIFADTIMSDTIDIYNEWKEKGNYVARNLNNIKKTSSLLDLIKKRRSIRKFKDTSISQSDLNDLVEAGIYAPSGSNTQCYRFKIITNKEDIKFLAEKKIPCVGNASAIILVASDNLACPYLQGNRKEVFSKLPYQDCAMSMQNICLLAEEKGISQCVIHLSKEWWSNKEIKEYFSISENYELQGMILLGYADETVDYENDKHAGRPVKRKTVEEYLF